MQYLLVLICTTESCLKKTIFGRNIAEGVKLRKQRLDIINKKTENINNIV